MLRFLMIPVLALGAVSGEPPRAVFSVTLEKPFGQFWYDLEHFGEDTVVDGETFKPMIRSELNFPLDPIRVYLGLASFRSMEGGRPGHLQTHMKLWGAVSPAFSKMRDEDWVGTDRSQNLSKSQSLLKFSDTYSSVNSIQLGGEIGRELGEMHFFRERTAVGIGLGGTFLDYDILGLTGRQLALDGDASHWVDVEISDSKKVMTYLNYTLQSSLSLRLQQPVFGLGWVARLNPLIFSHSLDDHILRKKEITMDCWGGGGTLEASWPLKYGHRTGSPVSRLVPYLRMEFNRTWGEMTQTYYADSPDTPLDETGQSVHGIKTTMSHWLLAAGVHFNLN
jgi:hypothetical protein